MQMLLVAACHASATFKSQGFSLRRDSGVQSALDRLKLLAENEEKVLGARRMGRDDQQQQHEHSRVPSQVREASHLPMYFVVHAVNISPSVRAGRFPHVPLAAASVTTSIALLTASQQQQQQHNPIRNLPLLTSPPRIPSISG
ncbi:MAG: hypothetical protein M1826_002340 [Phylliscum demangeonii]|nr:MAG: hypothetical protein M1826_002340 [Phylliscum demangeonii]